MNWDTDETLKWVWNEDVYKDCLLRWIGNELVFVSHICTIVNEINSKIGNEIDLSNVNGNEIYIAFCKLTGNGNEPHW